MVEEKLDVVMVEAPSSMTLSDLLDLFLGEAGDKMVGGLSSGNSRSLLGFGNYIERSRETYDFDGRLGVQAY